MVPGRGGGGGGEEWRWLGMRMPNENSITILAPHSHITFCSQITRWCVHSLWSRRRGMEEGVGVERVRGVRRREWGGEGGGKKNP